VAKAALAAVLQVRADPLVLVAMVVLVVVAAMVQLVLQFWPVATAAMLVLVVLAEVAAV
jgi:hypothetical protein